MQLRLLQIAYWLVVGNNKWKRVPHQNHKAHWSRELMWRISNIFHCRKYAGNPISIRRQRQQAYPLKQLLMGHDRFDYNLTKVNWTKLVTHRLSGRSALGAATTPLRRSSRWCCWRGLLVIVIWIIFVSVIVIVIRIAVSASVIRITVIVIIVIYKRDKLLLASITS